MVGATAESTSSLEDEVDVVSLKAFHVFFVVCSVALCAMLSVWFWGQYQDSQMSSHLVLASASALGLVTLLVYGVWFLRKQKGVSYL